jgi:hypothetical protein
MRNKQLANIYRQQISEAGKVVPDRFIVREFNTKKDVEKAVVNANPDVRGGSGKKGSIRFQPIKKVEDKEQFTQDFLKTLDEINLIIVGSILPGDPDSPSGKFPSYIVKDEVSNNEFTITLGGGSFSNEGMEYERRLLEELEQYFDNKEEGADKPSFLDKLESALDVEFDGLDKTQTFSRRVKRPLTSKGPEDKGDEISDITLIDTNNKKYFISLKNIGGKTVSNAGAKGMFGIEDDQVKFTNKEKNNIGKDLMEAGAVNIKAAVRGLEDYKEKVQSVPYLTETHDVTDKADKDELYKFLGSAFDYGYIYVKQKDKKDNLEIADVTDEDKLNEFIGDITEVKVKYPYYINNRRSRKNISIVIITDKGNYSFDIRNASGGFLPNQINLVRTGSAKDIKLQKANISKVNTGSSNIENLL